MKNHQRPPAPDAQTIVLGNGLTLHRDQSDEFCCEVCGAASDIRYRAACGSFSQLVVSWSARYGYTARLNLNAERTTAGRWSLERLLSFGSTGYYDSVEEAMADLRRCMREQREMFTAALEERARQWEVLFGKEDAA